MNEVTTSPTKPRALENVFGADVSSAVSLASLCTGVTHALLQAEGGDLRFTTDGSTPTASVGFLVPDGQWSPDIITDPSLVMLFGTEVNILPLRYGPPLQS
jgi:hypothetical protein